MKKILTYLIGSFIAIQAVTPPLKFSITFISDPVKFSWAFLGAGVLSFLFIFSKANIWLKIFIPYLYLNTFISAAPYVSMQTFLWLISGAYFYLLCLEVEDWTPIFNIISAVLMLQIFLLALQFLRIETLLNFNEKGIACFGSVGNPMQLKSLILISSAFVIQRFSINPKFMPFLYAILIVCAISYFLYKGSIWQNFLYARGPVWQETIKLWLKRPFVGYGFGTFKALFHALSPPLHAKLEGVWTNAHNDSLQMLFDTGIAGFSLYAGYIISLIRKCRGVLLAGGLILLFTMTFYFPSYQNSTCMMMLAFLAFAEKTIRRKVDGNI